ncbi:MAG: PQQ-binding-like beta-propeller repeat protein [Candidatus Thermoplasmatota archaeon]|nr:PQQ-binding-like beta-propeller repeat protein [Candidatus Thermoplasmatota archaeon]
MRFLFMAYFIPCTIISLLLLSSITMWNDAAGDGTDDIGVRTVSRLADEDSWTMYKGDLKRTGFSPSPIPLEKGTKPLWQTVIPALKPTNAPIVHNGTVYVGSGDGNMRGYDIDTGDQLWQVKASNKHISAPAIIDSGVIYFGADDGHVYGYDLLSAEKVFDVNVNTSAIFASPTIADGMLFIGTLGRNLMYSRFYGIDVSSQNISWYHDMGGSLNIYGFSGTAAYDDGKVYIGDGRSHMYCFDPRGFKDGNDGPYTSEENDTVGFADIIWHYNSTSSIIGSPVLAESRVYFGNDIGDFFALDTTDGSLVWKRRIGAGEPPSIQTSASYLDGTLYIASQRVYGPYDLNKGSSIHAVDPATGSQKWRFNATGQMLKSSPIVLDGALIFASGSGNTSVFCISTEDENIADEDRVLWHFNTGAAIWSPAAVAEGRIFICRPDSTGGNGRLYAFGSPEPRIVEVSTSDLSPFIGEVVEFNALVENNATVDVSIDIQFKASSFDFQNQQLIGVLEGVIIEAFSERTISVQWTVEAGYDMIVAFIIETTPEDKDRSNNFGTLDIYHNHMLSEGWLSSGGGPGRTGHSGSRLESNRTYWTMSLDGSWEGPPEDIWYGGAYGNGTISAAGGNLYMTGPDGSLICMSSNPATGGVPEILWSYHNSSVDLVGRPLLLVESAMSLSGPNRVFVLGDDGALWAFDWAGFLDGRNDGPYTMEVDKGSSAGDVVWRAPLPLQPSQAMFFSGGNVIIPLSNGDLAALDDDTGDLVWVRPAVDIQGPYAADLLSIFTFHGSILRSLDPHTGDVQAEYDLGTVLEGHMARSLSYWNGNLLISFNDTVALLDAYPDDNLDGSVDGHDEDLGIVDNGTGYDIIWKTELGATVQSPPTPSDQGGAVAVVTRSSMEVLLLKNGTRSAVFSLPEPASSRPISAGDSFYLVTGTGPWALRAYSPEVPGAYMGTWRHDLDSLPRGEGAIMGDNMFLSMSNGVVEAIGADNNAPVAKITSPGDNILLFPEEMIDLDASGSYDPEQDPITFAWYMEGEEEPIYVGDLPVVRKSLRGTGRSKLILRVFDDMRAVGMDSINVTLLKRITYPDHKDFLNDIYVHMSFGISEPSGAYIINSTVPADPPAVPGAVFIASIEFTPLPKYAQYRFEWANVSLGFFGREFPIGMHQERMKLYHFDQDLKIWVHAPVSGVDLENSLVWGNFSELEDGLYALGILDNSIPEIRHYEQQVTRSKVSSKFTFKAEFRDPDGDIPVYFKLVVDNQTEYMLDVDGILGSTTRFTYFSVEDVTLSADTHSYHFEVDDGYFILRSPYYRIEVENNPPVPVIIWQNALVTVREKVQFSAEGTTDIDGDVLTYEWDFDYDNVIFDRDAVGKIVSHEFYSPGVYNVTLRVSDGKDDAYKYVTVTVMEEEEGEPSTLWWILALVTIMAILIIAVVAFLVLSKKGQEEQKEVKKLAEETWNCPECGKTISRAVEECPSCGYEYDPLDFDEENEM